MNAQKHSPYDFSLSFTRKNLEDIAKEQKISISELSDEDIQIIMERFFAFMHTMYTVYGKVALRSFLYEHIDKKFPDKNKGEGITTCE